VKETPKTTGALCDHFKKIDRCTVLQHLRVLERWAGDRQAPRTAPLELPERAPIQEIYKPVDQALCQQLR